MKEVQTEFETNDLAVIESQWEETTEDMLFFSQWNQIQVEVQIDHRNIC